MKSKSERRFGSVQLTPVEHAKKRIRRHLRNHPDGVSTPQLYAWIETVRKGGAIYLPDFNQALTEMKNGAEVACAGDLWYLRGAPKMPPPGPPIDSADLPADGLFGRFSRSSHRDETSTDKK